MILRNFFVIVLVFGVGPSVASSQQRTGLGVIVGEPTGISFKYRVSSSTAVDAAAAWSFGGRKDAFQLHGDFLWHRYDIFGVERGRLPLFFGVGCRMVLGDKTDLGARVPVGLTYEWDHNLVDIFMELVPVLDFIPDTGLTINGALGARYWF